MKHWGGWPPFFTQVMRHWSSAAQAGFWRQVADWAQHFWARQLPQAVPSLGHMGGPQRPPLHCPAQHCAALVHMVPLGWQASWHVPLAQVPEQQSENFTHMPPLGLHDGGPQLFCGLHGPEQQAWLGTQACPLGVHVGVLQTPLMQALLQQGAIGLQGTPLGTHITGPQMPPLHWALQHWAGDMQGVPLGWHTFGPQRPMMLQVPEQQAKVGLHMAPSGRHIVWTHCPLVHASPGQQAGPPGKQAAP
jgi:hypothetical protein